MGRRQHQCTSMCVYKHQENDVVILLSKIKTASEERNHKETLSYIKGSDLRVLQNRAPKG
jgi:hypothetical protein